MDRTRDIHRTTSFNSHYNSRDCNDGSIGKQKKLLAKLIISVTLVMLFSAHTRGNAEKEAWSRKTPDAPMTASGGPGGRSPLGPRLRTNYNTILETGTKSTQHIFDDSAVPKYSFHHYRRFSFRRGATNIIGTVVLPRHISNSACISTHLGSLFSHSL